MIVQKRTPYEHLKCGKALSTSRGNGVGNAVGDLRHRNRLVNKVTNADEQDFTRFALLVRQSKSLDEVRTIHGCIAKAGLGSDRILANLVVDMYGKCGGVVQAKTAFSSIRDPNVYSWTSMITAYAMNGHCREAFTMLGSMQLEGCKPNAVTLASIFTGCSNSEELTIGRSLHVQLLASGLQPVTRLQNAVMNMYAKCECLSEARAIFDELEDRSLVSWTSMITAYAQHSQGQQAVELFWQMSLEGVRADWVTFISVLDACASLGNFSQGRAVHSFVADCGYESHVVVATALVNLYGKCGTLEEARGVFAKIKVKNSVSWSAMIAACAHHDHGIEGLELFSRMELEGWKVFEITYVNVLAACACVGALSKGKQIHHRVLTAGFGDNVVLGNSIVNMYAKCGKLEEARASWEQIPVKNVVSWNTIIAAYAQGERGKEALAIYNRMNVEGLIPTEVTFTNVLVACSHSGMLALARTLLLSMVADYTVSPVPCHYKCIADLLGRSGRVDAAEELMTSTLSEPDNVPWVTLLSACKTQGDVSRGSRLVQQAIVHQQQLSTLSASPYLLLSSIYAGLTGCPRISTGSESTWLLNYHSQCRWN